MNKNIEKYTGAVSVDGDVTPTTREKIDKVAPPTEWSEMSASELWEQKSILQKRITYACQSGHPELVSQIQRGINTLDQLLAIKQANQDTQLY